MKDKKKKSVSSSAPTLGAAPKEAKSSAFYQREFRRRLREQGLVKKEIWIRPENASLLGGVEAKLRQLPAHEMASSQELPVIGDRIMADPSLWTTTTIFQALRKEGIFKNEQVSIELIDGVEPAVHIVMHEYGDLPIFITASGDQIIVEAVLWALDDVLDIDRFNEAILRTHKFFPLSTISLDTVGKGLDYYYMFGALSANSLLSNVVLEIEMLAVNVMQATEAYSEFLGVAIEA